MTACRLALAQKWLDVDDMLDNLSVTQWQEWLDFDQVEGIGNRRICETIALAATAICLCLGARNINETFFMPWIPKREPDAEELVMKGRAAAQMCGFFDQKGSA